MVNRLYNDVGDLLDVKFRAAYNLTYFTMADKTNVDTSKFRRAIWNYIQCIYGIRHDDYDYGEVNQVRFDCFLIRFKRSEHKMYPEIMRTSTFYFGYIFHSEQLETVYTSVPNRDFFGIFFLKKKLSQILKIVRIRRFRSTGTKSFWGVGPDCLGSRKCWSKTSIFKLLT